MVKVASVAFAAVQIPTAASFGDSIQVVVATWVVTFLSFVTKSVRVPYMPLTAMVVLFPLSSWKLPDFLTSPLPSFTS